MSGLYILSSRPACVLAGQRRPNLRILFLNPPFLPNFSRASRSPAVAKSATLYYPIFLAYATGAAEAEGFETLLLDAPAMELDLTAVVERARTWKPDLCVIDTSTPSIENDARVAVELKNATGARICLVGTHVSALPNESLQLSPLLDYAAVREYDYTVRDLARLLCRSKEPAERDLRGIPGLAYRWGESIRFTGERPYIENLDALPFVSRIYKKHLSNHIHRYFYGSTRFPVMTILSGRGCPYACSYCVYPQNLVGHKYRFRSVENVVDEMEFIGKAFPQVREIFLEDDTLTVNRDRCRSLAAEIRRRGLKLTWTTNSRADADFQTLRELKLAGLRLVCVGFESGDQAVLDGIGKKITVEQMKRFAKNARKAGVMVHGCFLVGSKGESRETLKKTLDLALTLRPDTAQFYPIMVYPGTKAFQWAKDNGYIQAKQWRDWLTAEGLHNSVVSNPELPSEELVRFCDHARRRFYLRPRYLGSKLLQVIGRPREAKRVFRSARTFLRYLFRGSNV